MVVWRIYPDAYGKFWGHYIPYGCRNVPLVEKYHRNTWRWSGWNVVCFPFWNTFSRTEYADRLAQFDSRKGTNHAIQTSTEYVRNVPVVDQAFSAGFTDTQRWDPLWDGSRTVRTYGTWIGGCPAYYSYGKPMKITHLVRWCFPITSISIAEFPS